MDGVVRTRAAWKAFRDGGNMAERAQIFLAGFGVFSITSHGASADSAFSAHRGLGFAIAARAVIILILALIVLCGGPHALDGLLALAIVGFLYTPARRWQS